VSDNISTFFGYDNTEGCEIKVKATREKEIILTITDSNDASGKFVFSAVDLSSLEKFEIMMTNLFSIHESFSLNYGLHQNKSDKGISISMDNPSGVSFKLSALPDVGMELSIIKNDEPTIFMFKHEDKDILSRFKIEFKRLVANISNLKLPTKTLDKDTKHV
jgi:hypothetical protein